MRRNVERWAENLVNASIDMAKILLAAHGVAMPQSYRESLRNLSSLTGFVPDNAERLASFAKLRNTLAHEYLNLRFKQLSDFIREAEPHYRTLLEYVKKTIADAGKDSLDEKSGL